MTSNKLARNEVLFQEANQRMRRATARLLPGGLPEDLELELYCECANRACQEYVPISYQAYGEGAKQTNVFVVKPDHYLPEFEEVVERKPEYWLIRKRPDKLEKPFEI